jgi:isopentenyl-diphosphate delta-isomerase
MDDLVCVDHDDVALYPLAKVDCHKGDGVLHRAFSVFLLDPAGRILLQRRSALKPLWPGFWSNSCCSHPRWEESLEDAVDRRLVEELGVRTDVDLLHSFIYHARFGDIGSEREFCHVFLGTLPSADVHPDPTEISEVRWATKEEIEIEIANSAHAFTPWFLQEWLAIRGALPAS